MAAGRALCVDIGRLFGPPANANVQIDYGECPDEGCFATGTGIRSVSGVSTVSEESGPYGEMYIALALLWEAILLGLNDLGLVENFDVGRAGVAVVWGSCKHTSKSLDMVKRGGFSAYVDGEFGCVDEDVIE